MIMKKINFIWKYMVAGLIIVGFNACANDSEDIPSASVEVSRSTITIEKTIELTKAGTLQTKLEAAMAEEDVSTLQKLTLSGPFNGIDVQFWKTRLKNLIEFDLENAKPTYTEGVFYQNPDGQDISVYDGNIDEHMFSYMTKLEKIVFPSNVYRLGYRACSGCSALVDVVFPKNLENMDSEVFKDCISLKAIELPKKLTYLAGGLFQGCVSLSSVVWPDNLKELHWGVFEGCAFTSIEIPSSINYMDGSVFRNNYNLKSVKLLAMIDKVPDAAFDRCRQLEDVELSSMITKIGANAFNECSMLDDFTPFKNVKEIYGWAFNQCAFESLDLSNVKVLEGGFSNSPSLKSVKLSDDVKKLGDQVFAWCNLLEEINIPLKLEYIDRYALAGTAVKDIVIPETVTYIGDEAFANTPIRMLTIPSSVTEVGGSLVNGCQNLVALVWNSSAEIKDMHNVGHRPYLYLANAKTPYGPNWKNVIINGEAESVTLCEGGWRDDPNRSFYIPIGFKAKKVTFERIFEDWIWTHPGVSSGWQTIVLPFAPSKIEHETKGVIAPFNSEVQGAKPFWLRCLTKDGFKDVTTMSPNVPYIIAMPNHDNYLEEYRLYGKIIFSAENVDIAATSETLTPSEGPDYSLQPTYQWVQAGPQIYALNYNYWIVGYEHGGVFARSTTDVYAFEAYVVPHGRSARSVFEMDTRSSATRDSRTPNKTGIPQIGDM